MIEPLRTLPFVGRAADVDELRTALQRAAQGYGSVVLLTGEPGVGKTRLATSLAADAARRGFTVSSGRAYPVEAGVPYAIFADALLPLLRSIPPQKLSVLARGGEAELAYLFPALATAGEASVRLRAGATLSDDPAEFKTRLLWTITQVIRGFASTAPLLLLLDDIHLADASSRELLHFIARHTSDAAVVLACTYPETERRSDATLRALEKSLLALDHARPHRMNPLTERDLAELLRQAFNAEPAIAREFASRLYSRTHGNPFFVQEILRSLVQEGTLRRSGDHWLGWETERITLPQTVRDAVSNRLERLTPKARSIADMCAVIGSRVSYVILRAVAGTTEAELLAALDELRTEDVLTEAMEDGVVVYDFTHPMLAQVLSTGLGIARARLLHAAVADALETQYGGAALEHAGELAHHFSRAEPRLGSKAFKYLAQAGMDALSRFASQEAADYLALALALENADQGDEARAALVSALARARQRLGDYNGAITLWQQLRTAADEAGRPADVAALDRRIGLALYWSGRHAEALLHLGSALTYAQDNGQKALAARAHMARAACLMELGRSSDASVDIEAARAGAEAVADVPLLARAHRGLLVLHAWTGPSHVARAHGVEALRHATRTGEREVAFSTHWALAVLEGLTGNTPEMAAHIALAEKIAEEIRSPLLGITIAELLVEYCYAVGDWSRGIAVGERAIALARTLNQKPLLVRLLVWTSMIYLGRGEDETAARHIDEAWLVSEAGESHSATAVDVHAVVPAHIGRAAQHMARLQYAEAIRVGEAGLALADRSGYPFWGMHRLMPIIAESYGHMLNADGVARYEIRMRADSQQLDHRFGLAWADMCRAIISWIRRDLRTAAAQLGVAAESLEAIPYIPEAARARRQMAGRLAELGDNEEALSELRRVHTTFELLGAEPELSKTRGQFRELGVRPPARGSLEGQEGLSGRELEIARLVADRKSNKSIGKQLDISPRTVSTHLSNIFRKLGVGTRSDLTDYMRAHPPADGT